MTRPVILSYTSEVKKTALAIVELHATADEAHLNDEWILLEDSPRDPILQDPDRVWANIRQRLAERRRRELPPARPLAEFRRSCGVSQATLAGRLGVEQTRISKLERRSDLRISALRAYVASLGGTLVLLARMPDRDVQLNL